MSFPTKSGCNRSNHLRAVTYNIHHGVGMDGKYDLDRIARVLETEDADIIALQEIEQYSRRTRCDDQPKLLAEALKMNVAFTPVRRHCTHEASGFGNAILSRHPIISSELFALNSPGIIREARGCIHAELEVRGRPLHVFCVHLGLARRERHYQIEKLISREVVRHPRFGRGPRIILGDFNNWWPARSTRLIDLHFRNASLITGKRRYGSFNGIMNALCLDYIFVSPDIRIRDFGVRSDGEARLASDHRPVVSDLIYPK